MPVVLDTQEKIDAWLAPASNAPEVGFDAVRKLCLRPVDSSLQCYEGEF